LSQKAVQINLTLAYRVPKEKQNVPYSEAVCRVNKYHEALLNQNITPMRRKGNWLCLAMDS